MNNFFTKYNKAENQIFVDPKDADKYVSEYDLRSKGKKTMYKGVPRYDFKTIALFPYRVEVDFTMNSNYTEAEKKRMSIPKSFNGKKMVDLIGVYERINAKGGSSYTACCVGNALSARKICAKQRGLRGELGNFYYAADDKTVIDFFEARGFKTIKNSHGQCDRVSFVKNPNSEEEANKLLEDVYDFDKKFKR